eukprot:888502_1
MANHTSLVEELECKYTQYIQQLLRQKTLLLAKLQKDFNKELQRLNTLSVQVPSQNTKQVNSPHDEAVMTEFPVNTGANKANAILIDDEDMAKSQSESLQATQSDILTDTKYNALFTNPTPIVAAPPPPAMVFAVARSNTNVVANSAIIRHIKGYEYGKINWDDSFMIAFVMDANQCRICAESRSMRWDMNHMMEWSGCAKFAAESSLIIIYN